MYHFETLMTGELLVLMLLPRFFLQVITGLRIE
jgi:hypothetical protein